jgi:hypothetical protein
VLADVPAVLVAVALWLTGTWQQIWRRVGSRRTLAGTTLTVLLVVVNLYGIHPPGIVPKPREEACVYDVSATEGAPFPLVTGGSTAQQVQPNADRINSVSIIAGIDPKTAHADHPHPIKLRVRSKEGRINLTIRRDDIVNNAFSRFELPRPVHVRPKQTLFIRVFNESDEPVSVYIKQPGPTDLAEGIPPGAFVTGYVGNERGYEKTGYALSGCLTRPRQ